MKRTLVFALATAFLLPHAQAHPCTFLQENQEDPILLSRQDILKSADVLWAGEGIFTYLLDERNPEKFEDKEHLKKMGIVGRHSVAPLKDLHDRSKMYPYNSTDLDLIHRLLKPEFLDQATIFADAEGKQRISGADARKLISSIDSIILLDPKTGTQQIKVIIREVNPEDVVGYQAKQIVYYDQKRNCFQTIIEAVAPLLQHYNDKGEALDRKPMFWMTVQTANSPQDLHNADIPWARHASRTLPVKELTVIKNQKSWADCMDLHLQQTVKNAGKEDVRDVVGFLNKMPVKDIQNITQSIDTIITFDPETFTETKTIQKQTFQGKDVEKIRFFTEWIWDDRKKKMTCFTGFFAPIYPRFDASGNFLFEGPLFYKGL